MNGRHNNKTSRLERELGMVPKYLGQGHRPPSIQGVCVVKVRWFITASMQFCDTRFRPRWIWLHIFYFLQKWSLFAFSALGNLYSLTLKLRREFVKNWLESVSIEFIVQWIYFLACASCQLPVILINCSQEKNCEAVMLSFPGDIFLHK